MSNDIQYSGKNRAFVTQIVNAFRDRNALLFKDLFQKHCLTNLYKAPKEGSLSTDFWMLNDVFVNRNRELAGEDARFMMDTLVRFKALSAETKLCLYLWSFPHIDAQRRQEVFGEDGSLNFAGELNELRERIYGKKDGWLSSILDKFDTYHNLSIVKGQSPEDFTAKFQLYQAAGGNQFGAICYLQYEDEPGLPSSFDRYSNILNSLSEDTANKMVWEYGDRFYSYEMLRERGPKAFNLRLEFPKRLEVLTKAFGESDDEFFESLGNSWFGSTDSDSFAKLEAPLKSHLGESEPTQAQLEIFDYIEKSKHARLKTRFLSDVKNERWEEASKVVLDCFLAGDLPKLQSLIEDQSVDEFSSLFGAVVKEIVSQVPQLVSEGLMGERQKAFAIYLHEQSVKGLEAMAERLSALPTAKSRDTGRRRFPDEDMIVGVPYSVLNEEQRESIVDLGAPPMHPSMMHPGMGRGMHPAMFGGMPPGMFQPFGMHPFDLQDEGLELMARRELRLNAGLRSRRGKPEDGGFEP